MLPQLTCYLQFAARPLLLLLLLLPLLQSYGASWRPCGVDSLFLPGTQKFEVERLGFRYVYHTPGAKGTRVQRPCITEQGVLSTQ